MSRLYIHIEGETEEEFVKEILAPHLLLTGWRNIIPRPIGDAIKRHRRQGVKPWASVRHNLIKHLQHDESSYHTLMVDYYAMPASGSKAWVGREAANQLQHDAKSACIETALLEDIAKNLPYQSKRFISYVQMHEFEALLFSDCKSCAAGMNKPDIAEHLQKIRDEFHTPEHINDSKITSPSKRLEELFDRLFDEKYKKPLYGNLAALEIGLAAMRRECHGFNQWITRLEEIGKSTK